MTGPTLLTRSVFTTSSTVRSFWACLPFCPTSVRKMRVALTGRAKDADGFDYAASLLPPDHPWANLFTAE
jgi:hypothetical protein